MREQPMHFRPRPPAFDSACGRIIEEQYLTTDHSAVTCRQCRKSNDYRRTLPTVEKSTICGGSVEPRANPRDWRPGQEVEAADEPEVDDEPPPDVGPPGSGAVITEYVGNEPGLED